MIHYLKINNSRAANTLRNYFYANYTSNFVIPNNPVEFPAYLCFNLRHHIVYYKSESEFESAARVGIEFSRLSGMHGVRWKLREHFNLSSRSEQTPDGFYNFVNEIDQEASQGFSLEGHADAAINRPIRARVAGYPPASPQIREQMEEPKEEITEKPEWADG